MVIKMEPVLTLRSFDVEVIISNHRGQDLALGNGPRGKIRRGHVGTPRRSSRSLSLVLGKVQKQNL